MKSGPDVPACEAEATQELDVFNMKLPRKVAVNEVLLGTLRRVRKWGAEDEFNETTLLDKIAL